MQSSRTDSDAAGSLNPFLETLETVSVGQVSADAGRVSAKRFTHFFLNQSGQNVKLNTHKQTQTHIFKKWKERKSNGAFFIFLSGHGVQLLLSKYKKKNGFLSRLFYCFFVFLFCFWCFRFLHFLILAFFFSSFLSLSVFTWLCTGLLIVLISSAGALYLQ